MIFIFKIISIFIAGTLGVMSLLFDFKDSDGKVTNKGKWIIVTLILSSVISLTSTVFESHKAKEDAEEQLNRTTKVLHEFNRTQNPIKRVELTYWLELPKSNKYVSEYITYIDNVIEKNKKELLSIPSSIEGLDVNSVDQKEDPINVTIIKNSKFWPTNLDIIPAIVEFYHFSFYMKRKPISPSEFDETISVKNGKSDFVSMGFLSQNSLEYDFESKSLFIFGKQDFPSEFWKTNGKINSTIDLYDSQLTLMPNSSPDYKLSERYSNFINDDRRELSKLINIKTIVLSFSEGNNIWVDGKHFTKSKYAHGYPIFNLTLPSSREELDKLYGDNS